MTTTKHRVWEFGGYPANDTTLQQVMVRNRCWYVGHDSIGNERMVYG